MNTQYFNTVRSERLIHLSIGAIICCFFLCLYKDKIVGNDFKHRHLRTMARREKYKEIFFNTNQKAAPSHPCDRDIRILLYIKMTVRC